MVVVAVSQEVAAVGVRSLDLTILTIWRVHDHAARAGARSRAPDRRLARAPAPASAEPTLAPDQARGLARNLEAEASLPKVELVWKISQLGCLL